MQFSVKVTKPSEQKSGCLVLGVFESRKLSASAEAVDRASRGRIEKLLRRGDMAGRLGRTLLLQDLPGTAAERVLLVGCGRGRGLADHEFRKLVRAAVGALTASGAKDAVFYLTELDVEGRALPWLVRQTVALFRDGVYRFAELKEIPPHERVRLRRMTLHVPARSALRPAEQAVREATAIANGKELARDLGNLPSNHCTPAHLARRARQLARGRERLQVRVLEESQMRRLGMGALLAVARGSREAAKLIILDYAGSRKEHRPVVLVGKGVTFDSGGISLKPGAAMDEMKFDMCGAASVLGCISAASELELDLNVVGIIPATENLPDGQAVKPGDVVESLSGQTIEILNTDAEGRLILCDALTYASRFEPDVVIDVATLTGACVVALGKHPTGLFTNHRALGDALLAAGEHTGDRAWELPLWEEYQEQLKSNFADMANIGGRGGGAITAACFLSRFTKAYRWAHLDIAGTAWLAGSKKGATGRPVPMLTQYLLDHAGRAPRRKKERGASKHSG